MSKIIGIDLGTTNSVVAIMEPDGPKVITNSEGSRTTPSIVGFASNERIVGQPAKRQALTNPTGTIYSAKRCMGAQYKDIKDALGNLPYKVTRKKDGSCQFKVGKKSYTPQEISAMILQKLKRDAESYLGYKVTEAVITVPAYFNDAQRQATKAAGKIAGLEVKRIINEPTAAALAYGLDKKLDQKIAVFDLGGGTFDISILDISEGVVEVLSTNGDTHLGGDDVDEIIMEWVISEFKSDTGIDVSGDSMVLQRVKDAAEKAKIELSSAQKTEISLPFLTADAAGPKHLNLTLLRTEFDRKIESFIHNALLPVKKALKDSKLKTADINQIVLVGGSTRIPAIRTAVEKFFGKKSNNSVNPDEVVALGAAIQGGVFTGDVNDILLLDVTPLSLGVETLGGVMTALIERNTTIPCKKSEIFSTSTDGQPAVDVHVLQGERQLSKDNKTLGNFQFSGITPAPRGMPQIEVTFDIDANGIVSVSAKDKATDKEQSITIQDSNGLEAHEIEEMIKAAELNAEADQANKTLIEKRNQLDTMIYQSDKFLNEHKESLPEEATSRFEAELIKARSAFESTNADHITSAIDMLQSLIVQLGQAAYQEQAASAQSNQTQSDAPVPDIAGETVEHIET